MNMNLQQAPSRPMPLQTQQAQSIPPPLPPIYSISQLQRALALLGPTLSLTNNMNIFSQIFNIYVQTGLTRSEPPQTHHHHPHHYQQHLHNSYHHHHHHHHHGPNVQNNGQAGNLGTYSPPAANQATAYHQQPLQQLSVPVDNQINNQQQQASQPMPLQTQPSQPVPLQTQPSPTMPLQTQQSQQSIPPPPPIPSLYSIPNMSEALALLANQTIFNNVYNIYLPGLARSEPHQHHHHPAHHPAHHHPHHYNQQFHGSYHHHHHGSSGQNNGQDDTMLTISESKPRGLTRAEIDSLTPYVQMNEKDPRTCVICLSRFELKSKIRPLPCNHAYHAKCVDKWLKANRTCPICRRDALKTYGGKIKRI